jgi:hypothetical protein
VLVVVFPIDPPRVGAVVDYQLDHPLNLASLAPVHSFAAPQLNEQGRLAPSGR